MITQQIKGRAGIQRQVVPLGWASHLQRHSCSALHTQADLAIYLLSWELAIYTPWEVGMGPLDKTPLEKSFSLPCRSPGGQMAGFLCVGDICACFQPEGRCWGLLA